MDSTTPYLAIDIGNTSLKAQFFHTDQIVSPLYSLSHEAIEAQGNLAQWLANCFETHQLEPQSLAGLVFNESHHPNQKALIQWIEQNDLGPDQVLFVNQGYRPKALDLSAYSKGQLGADRVANLMACHKRSDHQAWIVLDFGTASTIDVLDSNGHFLGGMILPGIKRFWETVAGAIFLQTMPETFSISETKALGQTTEAALKAGWAFGYVGAIEASCEQLKKETNLKTVQVIATGGLAFLYNQFLVAQEKNPLSLDPSLTLRGLHQLAVEAKATTTQ